MLAGGGDRAAARRPGRRGHGRIRKQLCCAARQPAARGQRAPGADVRRGPAAQERQRVRPAAVAAPHAQARRLGLTALVARSLRQRVGRGLSGQLTWAGRVKEEQHTAMNGFE